MARKNGPELNMYTDGVCIPADDGKHGPAWGWIIVSLFTFPVITPFLLIKRAKKAAQRRKLTIYRSYAAVIAGRDAITTAQLAAITGRPEANVLIDVRDMIDKGYLGARAILDRRSNTLYLRSPDGTGAHREPPTANAVAAEKRWKADMREYCAVIGQRRSVQLRELAETTGKTLATVRRDIQRMLDEDRFGAKAYIDHRRDILCLQDDKIDPAKATADAPHDLGEFERILQKIHTLNERIEDPRVSEKIDRIGMQAASIFSVIQLRPERAEDAEKVLNYYLPTTFRLLEMYDMMEEEPRKTAEIRQSMERIEASLDLLIRAFGRIRERMMHSETLDVDADIDELNATLITDGLFAPKGTDINEVRGMGEN